MRFLCAILLAVSLGQIPAQQPVTNNSAVRFCAVDVFVDSNATPLAAYQLEFTATNGIAKIVGIEGGEHPAFAEPPFYDPKAMQHERVILAGFSTNPADKLPIGRTRVATIHLQVSGEDELKIETKFQAAAGPEGTRITSQVTAVQRKSP